MSLYNFALFFITLLGGSIPLWVKRLNDNALQYLLAFSGAFLLSITLLHLLPETFEEIGHRAGLFLLAGFFIQLVIQRLTHGVEHGHMHVHEHNGHKHIPVTSILLGISIHAFMEGLPLGFNYRMETTEPALYMAVAAHKLPEAILVTSLIIESGSSKTRSLIVLATFSAITPFSGYLANRLGMSYHFIANLILTLIPIVAGAFIHISTTIFFESGTRQHLLTWKKIFFIIAGLGIGLLTTLFE